MALEKFKTIELRRGLAVLVLIATMFSLYLWGPVHGSRHPSYYPDPDHPQNIAANEALAMIPPDAVVAAEDKYAAHLANREAIYVFPNPYSANYWGDDSQKGQRLPGAEDVEYVMVIPAHISGKSAEVYAGLQAEGFVTVFEKEGVVLLHRERRAVPQEE
jgi:hypothetical protein